MLYLFNNLLLSSRAPFTCSFENAAAKSCTVLTSRLISSCTPRPDACPPACRDDAKKHGLTALVNILLMHSSLLHSTANLRRLHSKNLMPLVNSDMTVWDSQLCLKTGLVASGEIETASTRILLLRGKPPVLTILTLRKHCTHGRGYRMRDDMTTRE